LGELLLQTPLTAAPKGYRIALRAEVCGGFIQKGGDMGKYIVLSNLTDEGRKKIKKDPGRIHEVNKELEKMGVKVKEQFAVMGPYDFVNIVEAPDNETMMRMSVELGSRGSVQLMSMPAVGVAEFIKKVK
jgi:uncharacterized protein with GYD domain